MKQARALLPMLGLAAALAQAAGDPAADTAPGGPTAVAAPQATQPALETARAQARSLSERIAREVDQWFGDLPFEAGGKVSDGRASVGVFHRRDQGSDVDVRFTARFRLPNVERSAYLFIGRDQPGAVVRNTPQSASNKQRLLTNSQPGDRSFLGGFGLSLRDDFNFRVGVGARLQPFVQVRYDKPWTFGPGQTLSLRETVFWTPDDRLGSTTALSYDLALQPQLALRWLSAATITQASRNVEWHSSLGTYRSFGDQRLMSLELLFSGTQARGTGVGLSDRGVLAKWEQPLYKDWLLGEVMLGHFWLRPDSLSPRGRAWALGAYLKMDF